MVLLHIGWGEDNKKELWYHQPKYNHLIRTPSRHFILDTMLPTPWRLLNTWQNFFSGAELLSATILPSTACIKMSTLSELGQTRDVHWTWLFSCLVTSSLLYRTAATSSGTATQCFHTAQRNIVGTRAEPSYEQVWLANRKDMPLSSKLAFQLLYTSWKKNL